MKKPSIWHTDISEILFGAGKIKKIPMSDVALICRKAAILLGAGTPIKTALPALTGQFPKSRVALSNLHDRVVQGESFSAALRGIGAFPGLMCGLCLIGEATASLPKVMDELANHYEARVQARSELVASLIYPLAVSVMMLAVIVLTIVLVLPGYEQIFAASGVELPRLTRGLILVSGFVIGYWHFILLGVLAAFALGYLFFRSERGLGVLYSVSLHIPLVRQFVNLQFVQALELLISAGLSVSAALPYCVEIMENRRVRQDLILINQAVGDGADFAPSVSRVRYFDPIFVSLVAIGEESGNMRDAISSCRRYLAQGYGHSLKRLNKLVEPLITITLGVVLGMVMLAIILPTFEMAMVV